MIKNATLLIFSIGICLVSGIIGSFFTTSAIPNWYQSLNKPFFSPPNFVFGPVWTTLYILMGISLYLVLRKGFNKKQIKHAGLFFFAQLFFNFVWSIIFFGFKNPLLAFLDILILLILIIVTIYKFYKIEKWAAYLLIPYLLWVSFATVLNLAIVILN